MDKSNAVGQTSSEYPACTGFRSISSPLGTRDPANCAPSTYRGTCLGSIAISAGGLRHFHQNHQTIMCAPALFTAIPGCLLRLAVQQRLSPSAESWDCLHLISPKKLIPMPATPMLLRKWEKMHTCEPCLGNSNRRSSYNNKSNIPPDRKISRSPRVCLTGGVDIYFLALHLFRGIAHLPRALGSELT